MWPRTSFLKFPDPYSFRTGVAPGSLISYIESTPYKTKRERETERDKELSYKRGGLASLAKLLRSLFTEFLLAWYPATVLSLVLSPATATVAAAQTSVFENPALLFLESEFSLP